LNPRSQRLLTSVATKGNRKASNFGHQQIVVQLLRVDSDVAVNISRRAYCNRRAKSGFRKKSKLSLGVKSNVKLSAQSYCHKAYLQRCPVQSVDQEAKSVFVAATQVQEIRHVKEGKCVSNSELFDVTAAAAVVVRQCKHVKKGNSRKGVVRKCKCVNTGNCKRVNKGSARKVVVKKSQYVKTRASRIKFNNSVNKGRKVGEHKVVQRRMRFGTWNVRSLSGALRNEEEILDISLKVGRPLNTLPSLMNQMVRWDLDFMGVQETKLKGSDTPIEDKEVTFFYSGGSLASKERMHAGVGLLVRNKWVSGIEKVFYKSERIIWLIGCFDGEYIAVVAIYVPTDLYPSEEKVRFYDKLHSVYVSIPKKYKIKAIMGISMHV
jgi:hypothetical protein